MDIAVSIKYSARKRTMSITVKRTGEVEVRAPYFTPRKKIEKFVKEKEGWIIKKVEEIKSLPTKTPLTERQKSALKKETQRLAEEKVKYYSEIVGVSFNKITIRAQKTLWGSCTKTGNLSFNCMLIKLPEECFNYVVIHELCHRKQMNHSKKFWAEVERVMPDYKRVRKRLRSEGKKILCTN